MMPWWQREWISKDWILYGRRPVPDEVGAVEVRPPSQVAALRDARLELDAARATIERHHDYLIEHGAWDDYQGWAQRRAAGK